MHRCVLVSSSMCYHTFCCYSCCYGYVCASLAKIFAINNSGAWIIISCTDVFYRLSSPVSVPPRPPIRPRHTLRSIGSDEGNVAGDSCDGKSDPRNFSMSPSYVDPKELNTTFARGQSQE